MWPIVLGIVAVLAVGGYWAWRQAYGTYHFVEVDPGKLYRIGNRGMREFENARIRCGFKTVVILVDDDEIKKEPFAGEMKFCSQQGIRVVRIPVILGGWPTSAQVQEFLKIAQDPQCQPVVVHCAQGVRRTGMMVAAYEESVLGRSDEQARAAMKTFGHSDRTVNDIRRFIEIYDAKMKTVTKELPQSKE
jgi:protein tyrosine phosphatase (PTP) superfamily phosphohydrolase (DUF442 family)